jgi:hypothetical protein
VVAALATPAGPASTAANWRAVAGPLGRIGEPGAGPVRYRVQQRVGLKDKVIRTSMTLAFDPARGVTKLTGRQGAVLAVSTPDARYVPIPPAARGRAGGKAWLKLPSNPGTASGPETVALFNGAPSPAQLRSLAQDGTGTAARLGPGHYRFTTRLVDRAPVQLEDSAPAFPTKPTAEVWLGPDGTVRRLRLSSYFDGFVPISSSLLVVFDPSPLVDIAVPADADVFTVTDPKAALDLLGS